MRSQHWPRGRKKLLDASRRRSGPGWSSRSRLSSHVGQAKRLLADGGAIGRKLDFLAQELHRESNTLTAKANDVDLTNIGLELKSVIEQFREQVQNLE